MKNRYYLIEPIDIDGDKNPDGFLVSQYRIAKNGNKIFLKNKYVTYDKLKIYADKAAKLKKGGIRVPQQIPNNMVVLTPEQYNQMLNAKNNYPQNNYPQNNYGYQQQQQPAPFIYKDETGFYNNFKNSAGSAAGTGLVYSALGWANVGIASMFFGE
jgi:hypothetical protein